MLTVIVRRLLLAIPTMIALTALLFFSLTALLGSPAALMLGQDASPEAIAALNARYGFDRPLYVQYFDWITSAARGDFGRSHTTQQSVASAVLPCILVTLELAVLAIVLAAVAAVVTNTLPAGRRVLGPVVVGANLIGITVPNFMLGISLIFVFSVGLGWLPSTGWITMVFGCARTPETHDPAGTHAVRLLLRCLQHRLSSGVPRRAKAIVHPGRARERHFALARRVPACASQCDLCR